METRSYKKNRFVIILVAIAGMSVYLLPYFRYYYYDAYVAYFGINDLQRECSEVSTALWPS